MVHEEAVDDGLAVAVRVDRRAEDFGGVERWRGGEADLHGVEVVEHATVFRDVVVVAAKRQFGVRQLAVEQVAAMALVHDNAVVLIDGGRRGVVCGIQHATHHALHRGDVDGGFGIRRFLIEFLDAKNVSESLHALHASFFERIRGLLAERRAIHEEQDAAEAFGFQQAIDERDASFCLSRAGSHREEHRALAFGNGAFRLQNCGLLVVPNGEPVVESLGGELPMGGGFVAFEQCSESLWRVPSLERIAEVVRSPEIAEPSAAVCGELPQVRAAI